MWRLFDPAYLVHTSSPLNSGKHPRDMLPYVLGRLPATALEALLPDIRLLIDDIAA